MSNSFLVPLTTTGQRKALIGSQFVQQANCHTIAKISPTLFSSLDFSLVEFITPPDILWTSRNYCQPAFFFSWPNIFMNLGFQMVHLKHIEHRALQGGCWKKKFNSSEWNKLQIKVLHIPSISRSIINSTGWPMPFIAMHLNSPWSLGYMAPCIWRTCLVKVVCKAEVGSSS